jgi:5-methylcytosine-specific restriction enzyme A
MMTRPNVRERGYDSRWDPLAREFKAHYPFCLGCWALGLETPTEVVDHIMPLAHHKDGLLDQTNLQPSCRWHHDVCKRHLELMWKLGQLPELALKLDSLSARVFTRERYPIPIGVDGYPLWQWSDLQRKPYPGGRP